MTCCTMCPEGRGQGFGADSARTSAVSVVDILSASIVKGFGALSLSGLNLFGHWLSLLVRENRDVLENSRLSRRLYLTFACRSEPLSRLQYK